MNRQEAARITHSQIKTNAMKNKLRYLELGVAVQKNLRLVLTDGRSVSWPQCELPLLEGHLALWVVEFPADLRELEVIHALPEDDVEDQQIPGLVGVNLKKR